VLVLPRQEDAGLLTLAGRREIKFGSSGTIWTPVLVPSFSSRVLDIDKPLRASEQFIDGPILISAYDVKHGLLSPPYDFGSAIFLDSGGYEISRLTDLSDVSDEAQNPLKWPEEDHAAVLADWNPKVPSVVISYDNPTRRYPVLEQIRRAKDMKLSRADIAREILIKPETVDQHFIQVDKVLRHVRDFDGFGLIGVTEKEVGNSVLERMVNIARLRGALSKVGLNTPIHVFGSLDTVTTLFYFVAGADVFDGLTWLRYAFKDGRTLYRQDFGISDLGISTKSYKIDALCWSMNYNYMRDMQLEMNRFPTNHDFQVFKRHCEQLKSACQSVEAELRM
jgi:queuine/archaeosine tRNA-ribosyltransferase